MEPETGPAGKAEASKLQKQPSKAGIVGRDVNLVMYKSTDHSAKIGNPAGQPYNTNFDSSDSSVRFAAALRGGDRARDRGQAQRSQVIPLSQMAEEEKSRALSEFGDDDSVVRDVLRYAAQTANNNADKVKEDELRGNT